MINPIADAVPRRMMEWGRRLMKGMSVLRKIGCSIGATVLGLMSAIACQGQAPPIKFNTAGAGAQPADVEAAVRLICPAAKMTRAKDGRVSGCSVCPRATDFHGDSGSSWDMYAETPGHFTGAKSDNLVLGGTGCDPHVNNFGGSFVFAVNAGKVRLMRYDQGLITEQCLKFAYADGRDGLVCRGGWFGQGVGDVYVFVTSFDAMGKSTQKTLITSSDTTGTCGDDAQVVQESAIKDVQLVKSGVGEAAQVTGLTVTMTLGKARCAQVTAERTAKAATAVKNYTIDFLFDGKRFTVAPASRTAMAKFAAANTQ